MNWSNVKWILGREIRDQLRDRRTLFVIAVLPLLLYPLLGMSFFQVSQFLRERPTSVLIVGSERLKGLPPLVEGGQLAAWLFGDQPEKARLLEVQLAPALEPGSPQQADAAWAEAIRLVQEGKVDTALYFPPDFASRLEAFRQAIRDLARRAAQDSAKAKTGAQEAPLAIPSPRVHYSKASERSMIAYVRLQEVMSRWTEEIGRANLKAGGVPIEAARPFQVSTDEGPTPAASGGTAVWAKVFPVLLLIWALTGAFYPAVDLCAGEKERGTLETLLCSPAQRSEIVLGKLLTIMLFSMATSVLNVIGMGGTGWVMFKQIPGLGAPPLGAALWLAVALVPISALFSALCLALAAFARSTKEGQYYLMPVLLVTTPLVVLPMAPGVELSLGNSLIPVTGVVLLLRTLLQGNYWQALQFAAPVILVTLGCCLLAIRWAVDQFNSESVLFRESERFGLGLWLRHLRLDRQPTPTVALALFCGVVILLVRFFMGLAMPQPKTMDFQSLAVLTMVTQLAVIATPALLMSVMLTSSPAQTLGLRRPPWLAIPAAALLALVFHPAASAIKVGVLKLYPLAQEVKQALQGLELVLREASLWQLLLLTALVPAIVEELAFRGFILSGFRHLGHKWRAIVYTAVFFGLTHYIIQQSIVACLVGIVIGVVAVQSGSIFPAMVFHLVHNSLPLVVGRLGAATADRGPLTDYLLMRGEEGELLFRWPAVGISILLSAGLLAWFLRLAYPKSAEEELQDAIRQKHAAGSGQPATGSGQQAPGLFIREH